MRRQRGRLAISGLSAIIVILSAAAPAHAGMPTVTLTDIARARVQAISFFLVVLLASAWGIRRIWNGLRREFPRLPKLNYRAALGLTTLWGLLFLLVLTMISGARELMTPGAWTKKPGGLTYTLDDPRAAPANDAQRRKDLLTLHGCLLEYAAAHDGAFPPDLDDPQFADAYHFDPEMPGAKLAYVSGLSKRAPDEPARPLVLEPDIYGETRLVLMNDGAVLAMTNEEIQALMATEAAP